MTIDRHSSIAKIVLEHSECAAVLAAHRLDFCCRGERSVTAACAEKGLDVEAVCADLERAITAREERDEPDPRDMPTPDLVSFIVLRHHVYAYEALRFLEPLSAKVARVHGDHDPRLLELRGAFRELAESLEPHMREEESVLFPALTAPPPDRRVVATELESMQRDHMHVGDLLARIRTHAGGFVLPAWACGSYRTLMLELAALELDTLRHIHLETHVLMPRFAQTATSEGRATSS